MNDTIENVNSSLCKDCKFRFRCIIIPSDPDKYIDENGESLLDSKDETILIVITCLISGMELNDDAIIECNKFCKNDSDIVPFFKHF